MVDFKNHSQGLKTMIRNNLFILNLTYLSGINIFLSWRKYSKMSYAFENSLYEDESNINRNFCWEVKRSSRGCLCA